MNERVKILGLSLAVAVAATATPALAQDRDDAPVAATVIVGEHGVPQYNGWQTGWDNGRYDRRHVILGTVVKFRPYRLTIARRNGNVQTVDLKNGTRIVPQGMTPTENERVAIVGYYSQGTFIANRVLVRA